MKIKLVHTGCVWQCLPMEANTTTKNEKQTLKLKRTAYRIAKRLLAKQQQHRSTGKVTHDFKSFSLTVKQSTPSRKTCKRGITLFVSVVVGYKESGHALLDALNSKYREQTVFSIGERGGLTLWNAATKNGKPTKSNPKGIMNILHHAKF